MSYKVKHNVQFNVTAPMLQIINVSKSMHQVINVTIIESVRRDFTLAVSENKKVHNAVSSELKRDATEFRQHSAPLLSNMIRTRLYALDTEIGDI